MDRLIFMEDFLIIEFLVDLLLSYLYYSLFIFSDEVVADILFTSNFHQYFFGIRLKDRSNQLTIKM
jgi:hypothetical protein